VSSGRRQEFGRPEQLLSTTTKPLMRSFRPPQKVRITAMQQSCPVHDPRDPRCLAVLTRIARISCGVRAGFWAIGNAATPLLGRRTEPSGVLNRSPGFIHRRPGLLFIAKQKIRLEVRSKSCALLSADCLLHLLTSAAGTTRTS